MNGQYDDLVIQNSEVDRVGKPIEDGPSRFAPHPLKHQGVGGNAVERFVEGRAEHRPEPGPALLVPVSCLKRFRLGFGSKPDSTSHSRSISFRRTLSQGITESGFSMCSLHRRSISAASSGLSSNSASRSPVPRLSQRAIASSARRFAGSFKISEREGTGI